ncbi:hypothetical protein C7I85_24280 [Mesorhizobium soli]|uniref:CopG family transcriptional regulator n=1 Tax=Pseudaminobacter soli (ex Li et al. 2025) TaxID=1295366 RepID=A0A2P7S2K3_9HYPH|nr:hypothetical protein C7I85_24280 [Mesorhizobium soli]
MTDISDRFVIVWLAADERQALRRLASVCRVDLEEAAAAVMRECLIATGYLEPEHGLDADTETAGSA